MRKSCHPTGFEPCQETSRLTCSNHGTSKLLGLDSQGWACGETSSPARVVEQWTGNPNAARSKRLYL